MKAQIDLGRTLPTEHQAIINALNAFLSLLPEDQHSEEALRMAMVILEAADVAPQAELAQNSILTG